jgi:hypothetical protein
LDAAGNIHTQALEVASPGGHATKSEVMPVDGQDVNSEPASLYMLSYWSFLALPLAVYDLIGPAGYRRVMGDEIKWAPGSLKTLVVTSIGGGMPASFTWSFTLVVLDL